MKQRIQLETPGIARVEMTNRAGLFATLDRQDFDRWVADGRSLRWFLNGHGSCQYVRVHDPNWAGGLVSVVRLLLDVW